jgi:cytochrome P450
MSSYDPLIPAVTSNPYPHYTYLREQEPVAWIPSLQGFAVARWDDVVKVLTDSKTYSSTQFWPALLGEYDPVPEGPPMISIDPPDHVPIRKLSGKVFVPSRVGALQDKVVRIAHALIDDIIRKHGNAGEFDYVAEFSALFPATVISEVLGVEVERRVDFKHWVDDLLSAGNRASFPPERLAQIARSSKAIRAYFEEIYERRSAVPGDDLLSGFIHAEVNGTRLTRIEVLNLGILLLLGGVETTANLLGITVSQFKKYPEVLAAVRTDPARIPLLIEEVLRYDSPVQMLFRHTTQDAVLADVRIPAGALMLPLLGSANRDPRKFNNADRFELERNPKEIISFGHGPHFCLGQYLSRMEAKTAIGLLLERFETLMPLSEEVLWTDTYFARGPKTLPVRFKVR